MAEADGVSLADAMSPDAWPQQRVSAARPGLPFYVQRMDTGRRLLGGGEPLLKVQLTRLADGDVLSLTACHILLGARGLAAKAVVQERQRDRPWHEGA